MHGQIGQHFTVHFNTGFSQPVDKLTIGQPMRAGSGIDALNPQGAEITLAGAAVAIGILTGFRNSLLGYPNGILAAAV